MKLSAFIMSGIALTIQYYANKYKEDDLNTTLDELEPDLGLPNIKTYDFIVVGGGIAGCLLAGRLSEYFEVLLLEAGGSPVPATYNPYLNQFIASHPAINNLFVSQRQFNFTQDTRGILVSSTGRMLGGSGSHNGNMHNRASPHDYDNYAKITGDDSWSYENILKHFKTLEGFHGRLVNEGERHQFYGSTGPLYVETDLPPILKAWFQSGKELGFGIGDPNGYQKEGFTPVVKSIKNGERVSTYTAFVKPFESSRSSLKVLRYSEVQTILIDEKNQAYGVTYLRHGIPQIAHASKEVIISAGPFSSPLLLMKSGIGPKKVLNDAKIPLKKGLPGVGRNLKNHGALIINFDANTPNWSLFSRREEQNVEEDLKLYQNHTNHLYSSEMDYSPQAFIVSSEAKKRNESHWPDIQLLFRQRGIVGDNGRLTLSIEILITRPQSVGEIGLNTTAFVRGEQDDTKLALVDHRTFSQKRDVDVMIEGIKLALKIMEETATFHSMNVTYRPDVPESCANLALRSNEYWRCHIRERAKIVNHFAGTCKMGRVRDPLSVVDSKLRVKGISNLRVVDASIMPQPTNANTAAPTMVIAEKASYDILNEYLAKTTKDPVLE